VVDSELTRSFLDTGPAYAQTGWSLLAPKPLDDIRDLTLGALTLVSGLDRIGLSSYLRHQNVSIRVVPDRQGLVLGISEGAFDGGVTESLLAESLAAENGWWAGPLPGELARYSLVFGLWKGDLTLKRKIVAAFRQIESDGTLASILARYGVAPTR
jgi:polar amino acid transport system substrate-binding protein/cystine transport system substrate-binding protein/membrane-bound lytic murein transglycosylase F